MLQILSRYPMSERATNLNCTKFSDCTLVTPEKRQGHALMALEHGMDTVSETGSYRPTRNCLISGYVPHLIVSLVGPA